MEDLRLSQLYLGIVETAVDDFDRLWTDVSDRIPRAGFFDFRLYGDWTKDSAGYAGVITIPGNGMVGFCYAILLTETTRPSFGKRRRTREELMERLVRLLRWTALTHAGVKGDHEFLSNDTDPAMLEVRKWRRPPGFRADEIGYLTLAAAKVWSELDDETRSLLETLLTADALRERVLHTWYSPQGGNHDRVKQDLSSTYGAALLFPHHAEAGRFRRVLFFQGLDMVSSEHDFANRALTAGRPLAEFAKTWNLYPDYTSDHHGWAQVWYGADKLFEGRLFVELLSRSTHQPVPATFTATGNGYDGIIERMKRLALPESEPISVHGVEYDSYYSAGVLVFCFAAVLNQDRIAAALEERAALLLRDHTRAVPVYDYHRNNWGKAGLAYLLHRTATRARPLKLSDAWAQLCGTEHHPWQRNLLQRDSEKLASFSWGSRSSPGTHFGGEGSGFCGHFVPTRALASDSPPLMYLHPFSLVGRLRVTLPDGTNVHAPSVAEHYQGWRDDRDFRTSGWVGVAGVHQWCAVFSFHEGPMIFCHALQVTRDCELEWTGSPLYFFVRDGLTPPRRYSDEVTSQATLGNSAQSRSSWWAVDDALGLVAVGEAPTIARYREIGRNWARQESYRDRCDAVAISPLARRPALTGSRHGEIVFACYPSVSASTSASLACRTQDLRSQLPLGWTGAIVADAGRPTRRYLALANLGGDVSSADLSLTLPEGAPVGELPAVITQNCSHLSITLLPMESWSDRFEVFLTVHGAESVVARRVAPDTYKLTVLGPRSTRVTLRHSDPRVANGLIRERNSAASSRERACGEPFTFTRDIEVSFPQARIIDSLKPAVEITSAYVGETGQVVISVDANDQSGVRQVTLFQDDLPVGTKTIVPYVWSLCPDAGFHRYHVEAIDASPQNNRAVSASRTLRVPALGRPPGDLPPCVPVDPLG